MNFKKVTKLPIILIGLMFIVGAIAYPRLPMRIPIDWGSKGVDAWGQKSFWNVFQFPVISLIMYILFFLLPLIDPLKRNYKKFEKTFNFLIEVMAGSFAYFFAVTLYAGFKPEVRVETLMPIGVGLLLIVLGNQMPTVKRNWFIGIRLPWTISSDVVWNKTHRLGGKVSIVAGFILIISAFISSPLNDWLAIGTLIIYLATITIYSLVIFFKLQKEEKRGEKYN